jgi:hypothetical protein
MIEPENLINDGESGSENSSGSSTPLIDTHPLEETVIESNGNLQEEEKLPGAVAPSFNPRTYQLEMREESLKRNIIVAVSFSGRSVGHCLSDG